MIFLLRFAGQIEEVVALSKEDFFCFPIVGDFYLFVLSIFCYSIFIDFFILIC